MIIKADIITLALNCHPTEPGEFDIGHQDAMDADTRKCLETSVALINAILIGPNDEPTIVKMRAIDYLNNPHAIGHVRVSQGNQPFIFSFKSLPAGYMNPTVEQSLTTHKQQKETTCAVL